MLRSLHSKIFLLVFFILALIAGSVLFITNRDVGRAMYEAEERSIANVLKLMELNVAGRYKNLLQDKVGKTREIKRYLVDLTATFNTGLDRFVAMAISGALSRERAQEEALAWIRTLPARNAKYFFVYDDSYTVLAYPEDELTGSSPTAYLDIEGRSVLKAARDEAMEFGEAYATYNWKHLHSEAPTKRFGLFTHIPEWDWIVAVSVDIDDVERALERQLQQIIEVLDQNIPQVEFAMTGFVFLFDGSQQIIAAPDRIRRLLEGGAHSIDQVVNVDTGNHVLDDFMAWASETEVKGPYSFAVRGQNGAPSLTLQADVAYFKPLDWYMAAVAPVDEIEAPARQLLAHISVSVLGVFVVSLLVALAFSRHLARPLQLLSEHAITLPRQDFSQPADGASPIEHLPAKHRDEVGRLASSFVFMERSLRENITNLMDVTATKNRIESELSIARDIQLGLLPKIFPPFPERSELDLHAVLVSAKEVGGDLYDFFFLDDNRLCLVVGDVSDKGVPAALFMAITKTLVKVAAERHRDPAKMLGLVNDLLSEDNPNIMFVTLIIGVLDLETGRFDYASGGHNPPIIIGREIRESHGISGPMAGAMDSITYKPLATTLEPGEAILLYTDGVTEAMNADLELFGEQRLEETLRDHRDDSAKAMVDGVMLRLRE
ncbi:MAG: SpoIIE family protein phosphatase, partial [Oceanidesulfovibrio sp.]